MKLLLILLAAYWVVIGVLLVILTEAARDRFKKFLKKRNMKRFSIVPILVGVLLIWGSSLVTRPWITVLLGIISIAKGLFFMFGQEKKVHDTIEWWLKADKKVLKASGVFAFVLGVILLLIL